MQAAMTSAAIAIMATMSSGTFQTKAPAPATSAACAVLMKDDASAALGESVTGPAASSARGDEASSCEYRGSGLHSVHLNLMKLSAQTAAAYKQLCAQKGKEGLTGLGDTACWYNAKHEELQVLKGLTFFSIEMRGQGNPTEAIKGVAQKVFDRIK